MEDDLDMMEDDLDRMEDDLDRMEDSQNYFSLKVLNWLEMMRGA